MLTLCKNRAGDNKTLCLENVYLVFVLRKRNLFEEILHALMKLIQNSIQFELNFCKKKHGHEESAAICEQPQISSNDVLKNINKQKKTYNERVSTANLTTIGKAITNHSPLSLRLNDVQEQNTIITKICSIAICCPRSYQQQTHTENFQTIIFSFSFLPFKLTNKKPISHWQTNKMYNLWQMKPTYPKRQKCSSLERNSEKTHDHLPRLSLLAE